MNSNELEIAGPDGTSNVQPADNGTPDDVLAWEEIAAGRYMPRRIRGSFRGRVLG
jgi:hypothetical protein